MNVCRLCGVDLGTNKKNRRSLSRNICCSVLTEIAVSSLETCQSGSRLDTSKFEEGYLCSKLFRSEYPRLAAAFNIISSTPMPVAIFYNCANSIH